MFFVVTNGYADVGEVSVSVYKGLQPKTLQLVGGLLSSYGSDWPLFYKIHFD